MENRGKFKQKWNFLVIPVVFAVIIGTVLLLNSCMNSLISELYKISVEINPENGGTVELTPEKNVYSTGNKVTAEAKAKPGYKFTGWSGASSSDNAVIELIMNGNKNLTANFEADNNIPVNPAVTYTLNVSADPAGGGIVTRNPYKSSYNSGETIMVTAAANDNYIFNGWKEIGEETDSIIITMDSNKTLTANFITNEILLASHTLTVNIEPAAGGTVTRDLNKTHYSSGDIVTLTAAANENYAFIKWSGASNSTNSSIQIIMDSDKALTAEFELLKTLTVNINPPGAGYVSSDPDRQKFKNGETVILTANSNSGYEFKSWSDNSTSPFLEITIQGDTEITANFEAHEPAGPVTYILSVQTNPLSGLGTVTLSPNLAEYADGTTVTVTANPVQGTSVFTNWTGASSSSNASIQITMNSNKSLTAHFTPIYTLTTNAGAGGTVSRNPNKSFYNSNETVTVTAAAKAVTRLMDGQAH